jgi:proline dehydrogenase
MNARSMLHLLTSQAAAAYIAGPDLEDALTCARRLREQGASSALCFWNAVADSPPEVAARYLETIERAAAGDYVSIKAPALQFETSLLEELRKKSGDCGVRLHFDSLGPEHADRIFEAIESIFPAETPVGCTLPGRWIRSVADAERAIDHGWTVRIVKGQWADGDGTDCDPHRGFLAVARALAGCGCPVSVATHHPALAVEALSILTAAGTKCELELLFGLPWRAVLQSVAFLNVPVRFYVPFGRAWLPYGARHLITSPWRLTWLMRDLLMGPRALPELQGKVNS